MQWLLTELIPSDCCCLLIVKIYKKVGSSIQNCILSSYKLCSGGVKGIISCVAAEAAMLSATCYLLPLITVRWLVLLGVSTSLTRLSLVLSHTACRSLNPGEKNEASFTTHLSAPAATAVGLGCLRRTDRRSALRIKIIPSEIHHQHGL